MSREHADPSFPALHGRPEAGWLNDPNGLALVDGRFHVFFQHNPHAPVHDRIAWGHASTADLVTWQQHPVAIAPEPGTADEFGCWTGCLTVDAGTPTLVYSGVRERGGRAEVLLARGDSALSTWTRDGRPVAPPPDPALTEVRDPFVVEIEGRRYAVQGAGSVGGRAEVLVYDCEDLERWVPLGALLTADDPLAARLAPADVWECPNLVPLGDRWVLVVSLWQRVEGAESDLVGVRYLLGDVEVGSAGPRFVVEAGGLLDAGPSLYAPQLLVTPDRVLLWGWAREGDRSPEGVAAAGWAGSLTFARELVLDGAAVRSRPVPELTGLRHQPLRVRVDAPLRERAFELVVPAGGAAGRLCLVTGDHEQVVAAWDDVPRSGVRVLVDGSVVEVFADGRPPVTARAYPGAESHWVVRGSARGLTGWRLAVPAAGTGSAAASA